MKRGQSVIDYVLIFAIAGAALVGMSRYMARAVRAHVQKTADELGTQESSMASSEGMVQDYSISFLEDDSRVTVQEQTGGGRATTYDQSNTNYGESIYIKEEEIER